MLGSIRIDPARLNNIRKGMAMAGSANEKEAAAALDKARAIMADHGIDDAMLALADIEEHAARGQGAMRPPRWESTLVCSVERALHVSSFIDADNSRRFIGRGPAAGIAAYAFSVLFRQLKAARKEYVATVLRRCKPGRKRQRADVYSEAWATAVWHKIAKLMPEPPKDEGIASYLAIQYPGLVPVTNRQAKTSGRSVGNDYWAGIVAGRQVELNQGVGGAAAQALLS